MAAGRVELLEADPELGLRIPAAHITRARTELTTPVKAIPVGSWQGPGSRRASGLGFLVLDGVLAREVILGGRTCAELVGEGDLIHPLGPAPVDNLIRYQVRWRVLADVKLAILDDAFARVLGHWPQVMNALLERAVRRTVHMSIHQALLQLSPVETRLLVLFFHLSGRWGRVTPAGVVLRLRLSHRTLGELVGCRRASVTTALHHVEETGRVTRRADGSWLLRGPAPTELTQIDWQEGRLEAEVTPLMARAR